jgi:hypothetical protein
MTGSELLLCPSDALQFISELADLEVVLLGADGWYRGGPDQSFFVQDLEADMSVDNAIFRLPDSPLRSAEAVRDFILSGLPSRDQYVSVTIDFTTP